MIGFFVILVLHNIPCIGTWNVIRINRSKIKFRPDLRVGSDVVLGKIV